MAPSKAAATSLSVGDRSYQGWGTPKRSRRSCGSGSLSADMAR